MTVTLLAGWVLHEPVSRLRWALVAGGFAGALIVIRPGGNHFGWTVLTGVVGRAIVTPVLSASSVDIAATLHGASAWQLAGLLAIGLLGTFGHLLLILAFGLVPTSTLMPLLYAQIAIGGLLGWFAFGQLPDAIAWLGMALLGACGAASAWLNVRDASAQCRPSAVVLDTVGD
ncbi:MAG: hypothetical protein ABIO45_05480 [Burkholderiaceae bacterium]